MSENKLPQWLFKITDQISFANSLVNKGEMYISPLSKFNEADEDGSKRNDDFEGVSHLLQADKLQRDKVPVLMTLDNGQELDISMHMVGNYIKRENKNNEFKIYSLYDFDPAEPEVDDAIFKLGEYVTIIFDVGEFLKRIDNKISEINKDRSSHEKIVFYYGNSMYVDRNDFHGTWNPFLKLSSFEYQKEFRILFLDPLFDEEIGEIFSIGDISDISQVHHYKDIID